MAEITLKGNTVRTKGQLPEVGSQAPAFKHLVKADLSEVSSDEFRGKRLILNIFPSLDTETCAMSVRNFNQKATDLENTHVLCVSEDLPFAIGRFCGAEGITNVVAASSFRSGFGDDYQVRMTSGPLSGLLSRAVVVIDGSGKVLYTQQVAEIADEPDYDAALNALK
ncbi:thiol peroxidase [Bowmanella dokdonensis]|uniref:Thiol peroxidase n=1 Tax=Bowmanella dokdonensis TaxID=751969 RepID=A0A939DRG9_9ALTE|nr:thiol peroxidase [Bowmanella dokdonensis]MBN7826541.1 thiol peroxidase [Bowmanella dokdonensis]